MTNNYRTSIIDLPRNSEKGEKDNFNITPFEAGLTNFINQTNTPITIALQGEWGSGKTSLMNSLQEKLGANYNNDFHSVWLNTWEYALMKDANATLIDIISGLIERVSKIANIEDSQTKKILTKLWSVGKTTAKFVAKNTADKVIDGASEIVEDVLKSNNSSSISEIRTELEEIIEKCTQKDSKKGFLFFIDDLDRIDPPVAVQLLELLKNIFTIKNCVFILAIDYDVVVKGLEPKFGKLTDKNEREFRSFFDKIIQVPFSMPVSSYKIDDFIKESLLNINYLNKEQSNNEQLISFFTKSANNSVGTNPRALKRLINSLSLIDCINKAKGNHIPEDEAMDKELELITNFNLVSIQIAYPQVYRLLSTEPNYAGWNENTAIQANLKPLNQDIKDKLNTIDEFDEEWEQVLFRLCENDPYLKRKCIQISKLLNSLKTYIENNDETVEDIISTVISISSVTNVESLDTPTEEINYHKGWFLKNIRAKVFEQLKNNNASLNIQIPKKRVQSNAYLHYLNNNGNQINWLKFWTTPSSNNILLELRTDLYVCEKHFETISNFFKQNGQIEKYNLFKDEYNLLVDLAISLGFEPSLTFDQGVFTIKKTLIKACTFNIILQSENEFYADNNLEKITTMSEKIVDFTNRFNKLIHDVKTKTI